MQRELLRNGADHLHDQAAVEADALGAGRYRGAGGFHALARFRQDDIHADLFEHGQRGIVDRLYLVSGEQLGLGPRVGEVEIGRAGHLAHPFGAAAARPTAASAVARGLFMDGRGLCSLDTHVQLVRFFDLYIHNNSKTCFVEPDQKRHMN